ncbi:MAG TPA: acyl carrier protein [Chloroflexota bacterium]|jgi:acyl carrier protein|nr:acyl carrier protein [Chloroflexota bacterium]
MSTTIQQVTEIVTKFAKNQAALATISPTTRFREDLDISSASLIDIVLDLEDTFSLTIEDDELKQITTVGAAVELIESKQKAGVS